MMKLPTLSLAKVLFISASLATTSLPAASVTSDPVGVIYYNFNTNADANIGLSVARPSAFEGRITSVDIENNSVTFEGNPGWATDQFIATTESHYLYIKSGAEEGMHVTVTGNTDNSITVFLDTGDRLDTLVEGEIASIVPYWTLDTLFEGQSPENLKIYICRGRRPTVGVYDAVEVDFINGEWRHTDDNSPAGDRAIFPNEGLLSRNFGPTFGMTVTGVVPMADVRIVFRSNGLAALREQRVCFFSAGVFSLNMINLVTPDDTLSSFNTNAINSRNERVMQYAGVWYDMSNYSVRTYDNFIYPGIAYLYQGLQNKTSEVTIMRVPQPYLN